MVTFRYVDTTGRAVRCFVPAEFNNWGPQSAPGMIPPGAVSQMQFSSSANYWWKTVCLEVGKSYAYKFHLHFDSAGTLSQWLPDPFNALTDGSQYGNSLVTIQPIIIFEPEFRRDGDSSIVKILAGCFSTAPVTKVVLFVDADSTDLTPFCDAGTGLLTYTPPQAIAPAKLVRLVARDALGREAICGGFAVIPSSRKLDVTFLFHANQNLVPYGKVGDRACFRGLLTTLRKHPNQKFLIHFSGTLIHDLQWFGDSTLQILRRGIQDGQFEIVGSTYAQNIMYSTRTDSADFEFNDHQIKIHKEEILKVLGATPKAFWNPERVWTQNFVQLLADNGYLYVPVEDHILQASSAGGSLYQVRTTEYNGRQMTVFEDDKAFLGLVDNAINSGDPSPVVTYLHQRYAEDTADDAVIGYYQDAEATGLWDYESRIDPQTNFNGLDALLTALESDTLINVTAYSDYMKTHAATEDLPRIVDGAAAWMGGDAWFSENMRPEFRMMRGVYNSLRYTLDSVATVISGASGNTSAANALLRHAWFTLCAHQFEFGCHGLESDVNNTQLQLARTSMVGATAALYAVHPTSGSFLTDINRDGVNEIVVVTPQNLYVFSSYGGRLLYWFDLVAGEQLVGNEDFSADYPEPYVNDNLALPLIRGGIETYPWLAGNPLIPEILAWTFVVRKRALSDVLTVGIGPAQVLDNTSYSSTINGNSISFSTASGGITMRKEITPVANGLTITYHLSSSLSSPVPVTHEIQNSFSPSYLDVLDGGRVSLTYWDGGAGNSQTVASSTIGVRNTVTGNSIRYSWTDVPAQIRGAENVFALEMNPVYLRTLNPGESVSYAFSILSSRESSGGTQGNPDIPAQFVLYQNYPNPFNSSTTFRYGLPHNAFVSLKVYDVLGKEVMTLVHGDLGKGTREVQFDASTLSSGVYFYRLQAGEFMQTKKLLLLR